jgi:predicted acetyltransferase
VILSGINPILAFVNIRGYDPERDLEAVKRIWFEIGWLEDERQAKYLGTMVGAGRAVVADIDDEAECFVHVTDGTIRHQLNDLDLAAVTAVTTSRIARKTGFAKRLTAAALANAAEAGAAVSALGMFDQGFYDKVGFGTGAYEHISVFDPASLVVTDSFRPPKRLNRDDFADMHHARINRQRGHGGVTLAPAEIMKAETGFTEKPFGFGYYDGPNGTLSHFIWGNVEGEHGPYTVDALAYQNAGQLMELLALIRSLGDQVSSFRMLEPGDIQLQDLLKQPFRHERGSAGSKHEHKNNGMAYWQLRVLDLQACLAKTTLDGPTTQFNLSLSDPVVDHLEDGSNWRGIAGEYTVTLGPESSATTGSNKGFPTLSASVGAFSRMWFGVRPASSLAITDELSGPTELLTQLDATLRLPRPHLGWDF